jgi:hypothetical protein
VEAGHRVPLGPLHLLHLPLQRDPRQQPRRQVRRLASRPRLGYRLLDQGQTTRHWNPTGRGASQLRHRVLQPQRRSMRMSWTGQHLHEEAAGWLAQQVGGVHRVRAQPQHRLALRLRPVDVDGAARPTWRMGGHNACDSMQLDMVKRLYTGATSLPSCPARRMHMCQAGCRHRLLWRACRAQRCPAQSGRSPLLTAAAGRRCVRFQPPRCEELPASARQLTGLSRGTPA